MNSDSLDLPRHPRFVDFHGRSFTSEQLQFLADSPSIVRLDFKDCRIADDDVRVICRLPRLQSLWLEGTQVTDAVLPAIAKLPKLEWLILDRTRVTGKGFKAFSGHQTLRTLWLSHTALGDEAMPLLAAIPHLSNLVLKDTKVTRAGLLSLATHPTVKVSADDQFSKTILPEFELAQRGHSNRTPPEFQPSPDDAQAAAACLQEFFKAITAWERDVAKSNRGRQGTDDWKGEHCKKIFALYCTPKDRKYGRPNVMTYARPPEYANLNILNTEWLTARKVLFYTGGPRGQHRFFVVKRGDRWLVDHKETLLDGWQRGYL